MGSITKVYEESIQVVSLSHTYNTLYAYMYTSTHTYTHKSYTQTQDTFIKFHIDVWSNDKSLLNTCLLKINLSKLRITRVLQSYSTTVTPLTILLIRLAILYKSSLNDVAI